VQTKFSMSSATMSNRDFFWLFRLLRAKGAQVTVFALGAPVRNSTVEDFQQTHGVRLPEDLAAFFRRSNGLLIGWDVSRTSHVGLLHVDSLEHLSIRRLQGKDILMLNATTALVYEKDDKEGIESSPQVFHCDPAGDLHFLAETFSDFMRLLFLHAGIRGWEGAFTSRGLDPQAKLWLQIFGRIRLAQTQDAGEDRSGMACAPTKNTFSVDM